MSWLKTVFTAATGCAKRSKEEGPPPELFFQLGGGCPCRSADAAASGAPSERPPTTIGWVLLLSPSFAISSEAAATMLSENVLRPPWQC